MAFNRLANEQVYHFTMLMLNSYDMHENHKLLHPSKFISLKELFVRANLRDAYGRMCVVLDKYSQEQKEADEAAKEVSSALKQVIKTFAENGKERDETANGDLQALSRVLYKFLKFTKPIMLDEKGNPRYKYVYVVIWDGQIKEILDICSYLNDFIAALNERFGPTLRPIKYML